MEGTSWEARVVPRRCGAAGIRLTSLRIGPLKHTESCVGDSECSLRTSTTVDTCRQLGKHRFQPDLAAGMIPFHQWAAAEKTLAILGIWTAGQGKERGKIDPTHGQSECGVSSQVSEPLESAKVIIP